MLLALLLALLLAGNGQTVKRSTLSEGSNTEALRSKIVLTPDTTTRGANMQASAQGMSFLVIPLSIKNPRVLILAADLLVVQVSWGGAPVVASIHK